MPHLQYEERKCSVPEKCSVPGSHQYNEKVVQCDERVYSIKKVTSAVREVCLVEEKFCSIRKVDHICSRGRESMQYQDCLHLQYEKKVVQCEDKVDSIRRATSAVGGQGVWCEQKLCSIRNVTASVRGEKV